MWTSISNKKMKRKSEIEAMGVYDSIHMVDNKLVTAL